MLFLIFTTIWLALCFALWRLMQAQLSLVKAREQRALRSIVWRN